MQIDKDCVVSINFRLTNDEGTVLDESPEDQPLVYLHGGVGILPALEAELTGKSAGDEFDVTIEPANGFGAYTQDLLQIVPRDTIPADLEPEVGMQVQAKSALGGGDQVGVIKSIDADSVTLDFNHPLAGMTLRFRGSVVGVRQATEEELQFGGPVTGEPS